MDHAQLTEEALQRSAALSEDDDAPPISDKTAGVLSEINVGSKGAVRVDNGTLVQAATSGDEPQDVVMSEAIDDHDSDEDMDAEGEADEDYEHLNVGHDYTGTGLPAKDHKAPDDTPEHAEDDTEAVGAVKIKPGDTDAEDEDEEDAGSDDSASQSGDKESEGDAAWEDDDVAENEDDDDEDDDGDGDDHDATSGNCMFCKEDEEGGPDEESGAYLACTVCGENAHQNCARAAKAIQAKRSAASWKCPECIDEEKNSSDEEDAASNASDVSSVNEDARQSRAPSRTRISISSSLRRESMNLDVSSNPPASDGDATEGPRHLRKRKTASADRDDGGMSLRKRRRHTPDTLPPSRDDAQEEGADPPQSVRPLRVRLARQKAVTVTKPSPTSLLVTMRVNRESLKDALSRPHVPDKKRSSRGGAAQRSLKASSSRRVQEPSPESLIAPFVSTSYSQPFYSFFDKETDEAKGKPYGGILNNAEADTSKTMPGPEDRRRFDEAKQRAEAEWKERITAMQEEIKMPAKKKKTTGPGSQIECIEFGGWEIDTWYAAPYPEEYSRNRVLYICEFCLKYMNSDYVAWRHKLKCPSKHPPGDEIYRHESASVFEVDGRKNPVYCQNLCLLAKLFLGSKTLYYDVEPFLFYVLCEYDETGYHFVGYFSKEKRASSQNNVSCILTLPIHQRKGYGNLLIDFSYLLTRAEQRTGSPEKPLSDMGLVSYRNYWRLVMCRYLLEHVGEDKAGGTGLSIRKISDDTGMTADDVIAALEGLRCLVRDPVTGLYAFRVDLNFCKEYVAKWEAKGYVKLNPAALTWTPYVMGRNSAVNFELGPAISAIAPREDDGEPENLTVLRDAAETGVKPALPNGLPKGPTDGEIPNGDGVGNAASDDKENKEGKAADDSQPKHKPEPPAEKRWDDAYKDIAPTRFVVYPPVVAGRRVERPRPSVARTPSTPAELVTPQPKPRPRPVARTSSTSQRAGVVRLPKSGGSTSSARKKSGGTGRGPGRWPKGTKKSDYGNADSGPGLPPAWIAAREREAAALAAKKKKEAEAARKKSAEENAGGGAGDDDDETKDVVQVQVKAGKGKGKGKGSKPLAALGTSAGDDSGAEGMGEVIVKAGGKREGGGQAVVAQNGAAVDDAEDGEADAEGEDE